MISCHPPGHGDFSAVRRLIRRVTGLASTGRTAGPASRRLQRRNSPSGSFIDRLNGGSGYLDLRLCDVNENRPGMPAGALARSIIALNDRPGR